jgi:alkyldihydroxyacetonephosphate synthase
MIEIEIDRESLLVHVDARLAVCALEDVLARGALTLDVERASERRESVGEWLASGADGARSAWLDPADHLVAGFSARLRTRDATFTVKPAPRRAVGPDLLALVLGTKNRFLALESVWLRVHHASVARPSVPFEDDSHEPLGEDEARLFAAIEREL